jgi:hypothetical protein
LDIRDKARAMEMYAHQAQNTEAERQAAAADIGAPTTSLSRH